LTAFFVGIIALMLRRPGKKQVRSEFKNLPVSNPFNGRQASAKL
jgi:hypothetical protein